MPREELTKVLTPKGEQVVSVLSAEDAELTQVENPFLNLDDLFSYADSMEENEYPLHEALANLLVQKVGTENAMSIMYELAAYGGISAMTQELHPHK